MSLRSKREILEIDEDGFPDSLFRAARPGSGVTLESLRRQLKEQNLDFTKDDFFKPTLLGKFPAIICASKADDPAITLIKPVLDLMDDMGVKVTNDELRMRYGSRGSIISMASNHGQIGAMLESRYWAKHPEQMQELWKIMSPAQKLGVDFAKLKAEAEKLNREVYKQHATDPLTKEAMFARQSPNGNTMLDHAESWDQLLTINQRLALSGEKLRKDDLLTTNKDGELYLTAGLKRGRKAEIMALLAANGEKLTSDDLRLYNLAPFFEDEQYKFWHAAAFGETEKVDRMLAEGGVNLEHSRHDRGTPLFQATGSGHIEIVRTLLEAGADPSAVRKVNNESVLQHAVRMGQSECAVLIVDALEKRFEGNIDGLLKALHHRDNAGSHAAYIKKNPATADIVRKAVLYAELKSPKSIQNIEKPIFPNDGDTLLGLAIQLNDVDACQHILGIMQSKFAGNPDALRKALTLPPASGMQSMVTLAQMAGNSMISYAIDAALGNRSAETRPLAENVSKESMLYQSACRGDTEGVRAIIAGGNVNLDAGFSSAQMTPLMVAAHNGYLEIVKLLLDAGANPDAQALGKGNALLFAVRSRNLQVVEAVIGKLKEHYNIDSGGLFSALTRKNSDGHSPYRLAEINLPAAQSVIVKAARELYPKMVDYIPEMRKKIGLYDALANMNESAEYFAPERWKGKLGQMKQHWLNATAKVRENIDFDRNFTAAFNATHDLRKITSKESILPQPDKKGTPLEYAQGWKQIKSIRAQLDALGQPLTKADLMRTDHDGCSLLLAAVKSEAFREAMSIIHSSGERLTAAELLNTKDGTQKALLEQLTDYGCLQEVFEPSNWVNHVREMNDCWLRVPLAAKAQLDGNDGGPSFKRMLQQANAASARPRAFGSESGRGAG